MCRAAIVILLVTMAASASAEPLDSGTKAYLKGYWAVMADNPVRAGCRGPLEDILLWESYRFSFRKNGSVHVEDWVDMHQTLAIMSAEKVGKNIRLTLERNLRIVLRPTGPNTMQVLRAIGPDTTKHKLYALRCSS